MVASRAMNIIPRSPHTFNFQLKTLKIAETGVHAEILFTIVCSVTLSSLAAGRYFLGPMSLKTRK